MTVGMSMIQPRADRDILDESVVYPGHPVTLVYLIVRLYPSLEAARVRGQTFAAVEEDGRLPGAGSHNSYAVALLIRLADGTPWDNAVASADATWARVDGQRDDSWGEWAEQHPGYYRERWQRGQEQADRIKPLLREALATWPAEKSP